MKASQRIVARANQTVIEASIRAQRKVAEDAWADIIMNAPYDTGAYITSIQIGETKVEGNVISTEIFTDLKIGGDDPNWSDKLLGPLLEYGTGLLGMITNTYPHGFMYRETPWSYYNERYGRWIWTTGMVARPHFYPALQKQVPNYRKLLKKEIRECGKRFKRF